ncbi:MAG TPA: sigma-54 dependent transcriptional regulator [Gemmatimonas sp.]|nr:sigma-54 dependent transcriptional regulator [Gemmatimonas sp.]
MTVRVHRLLLVDDDAAVRASLGDALRGAGFLVETAASAVAALGMMQRVDPDVVLTDVRMDDLSGLDLLRELRARAPDVSVVLMTAFDDMSTVVEAMKHGAAEFLVKPLDINELQRTLERVTSDRALRALRARQPADPPDTPDGVLVGRDPRMIAIYKLVGHAAGTHATVLIRGESGTGKELVARAIHTHANGDGKPFVPVNCAALPSTLLESELFGHVRGAFTGAVGDRKGRFAQAGNGTIFLDEIGDTSADFQSKLLRVLQDHEYQPVGSDLTVRTDARVIAATHQPLEAMITDRRFRQDLYYRLRVVEIVLPPLRERIDDIPLLAQHVLQRAARALAVNPCVLAPDAQQRLREHDWPGNVRELENCLMRAVVVASGGVIRAEHLSMASPATAGDRRVPSLEDLERTHVMRVFDITAGHKGRAADLLGVSRPRLSRLLEKYGLT